MALTAAVPLLRRARQEGYAIGAFNASNLESVQAIVAAAQEERAPVILQVSQGALKYGGLPGLGALARAVADSAGVPVAVHLDHGTEVELIWQCLRAGFTSVMVDGSHLPLAENAALTRRVVEVAHASEVSVEAELGRIPGTEEEIRVEEREAYFTDPDEAAWFVKQTGVDSLAVAIGTAHGRYRGDPRLDFSRLREIAAKVEVPLVLHGCSGLADEAVRQAIALGVAKLNVDTELREAFVGALRQALAECPGETDPRKLLTPAREAVKAKVREKIRLFGSSGKA
ncbi:MAG: class II fructose-1,6-bisphosphate aldolase [Moorellales bacterium]